ncbi:MAG: folylpolyglutamate synthase/dihydrofolate synthase family protein [Lachnospiraceae bacterium]|nr:folylpolyglutamate synthase/dihydrofolate synthase family protein [Lachnospiraceae bacterium]
MNYQEARAFMEGRQGEIHLGLDRIRALLEELDHPEQDLRCIHIAGTNGKGSILSYLSTTLTHAGYKTGRYISPTLYSYEERFQIDGQEISHERFTELAAQISLAVERMEKRGIPCPSPFELETVLCFLYFQQEHCEYVVLECGMGGEGDATNVIPAPVAAVLASISLDHRDFLGNTLREIAWTKSGIVKPGCICVTGSQPEEVMESVRKRCVEQKVPLIQAEPMEAEVLSNTLEGQEFLYRGSRIAVSLPGSVQKENAITAWTVLQELKKRGLQLTDRQIYEGMRLADWKGRFTCIAKEPYFIVDGAHNPAAAEKLADSVEQYFAGKNIFCIIGIFKDKDVDKILRLTVPGAKRIFTVETPGNPRAMPAEQLAEMAAVYHPDVEVCASLADAVDRAYQAADREDVILSFGSLSNIGELTELVRQRMNVCKDSGRFDEASDSAKQ